MSRLPKYIEADDVKRVLKMTDLIPIIEKAMGNFSKGEDGGVVQPARSFIPVKKHAGSFIAMCAYSEKDETLATKLLTRYQENAGTGIPTHMSAIILFEPSTGELKSIMDGDVITSMRTAAASAVATKYLAPENSKILCILGSGDQARSHYKSLHHICNFEEVRVWSPTFKNAQDFSSQLKSKVCETVEEAVRGADVIVTATFAKQPIVEWEWVKPGAHINAVGAVNKKWQELSSELMQKSVVHVDSREAAMKESGDVIISKTEIFAEIGDLVNGTKEAQKEKTTVFKSLGMAMEDAVSAKLVYDKHMENQ
ncbi:ketimine reductase mu-crystallin-like [Saccoglossus kowalevskii]|uniref:Ketimine reductase mu-crystallin n=1 Tax=Saccoglossus kowalevskii TaxID=10224 RepID=A0A1B1JCH0_SACKO|nr:PREDICTED: ketimine reductase mu-crystallin-like [Saccoglossus kowalevskii]ANS11610.1 ketimine reductase mu-crystallin-like protein [Saccoglossus kowalevskii]